MLDLKPTLQSLQNIRANPAVSIFVPTHRTFPDNQQDHIALKNQLKQLEEQLLKTYDKVFVAQFLKRIHEKTDELNPNYYLDTLAIFATADQVEVICLPFKTQARIMIDTQFVLRDFIRELSYALDYYIVVVTREMGRLIQASNNRVIHEFSELDLELTPLLPHGAFPVKNETLYSLTAAERSAAAQEDRYLKEFLNRVDKNVQVIHAQKPLPIVLVADRRNISFYETICDHPNQIIIKVDNVTQLENSEPRHIVDSVQNALKDYQNKIHQNHANQLDQVYGSERVVTDLQHIYQAALQGNIDTLYVQQGYSVNGFIDENEQRIEFSAAPEDDSTPTDVIHHIIDAAQTHGGHIVFLPEAYLSGKTPVTLLSRYAI
ncbi:AOC03_06830 family ribosome hibernation factor [Acinetobacter ursingii]|uniref:AOC03_06830 family ribosome hibernation factor n=1 Tax=Acinetobacter ursingii TaxID=108980 RepID=UPI0021CDD727|nr:hypothetical protein [Acinetobacter ursingii]MCU4481956.1 hypothetical protein [Acinetobacter ursingii]MCU4506147.1 hypothetical protein [Acinetobacter ursingii]MCU4570985.1 hypothetical protein [Acinetobacter ursingii]